MFADALMHCTASFGEIAFSRLVIGLICQSVSLTSSSYVMLSIDIVETVDGVTRHQVGVYNFLEVVLERSFSSVALDKCTDLCVYNAREDAHSKMHQPVLHCLSTATPNQLYKHFRDLVLIFGLSLHQHPSQNLESPSYHNCTFINPSSQSLPST